VGATVGHRGALPSIDLLREVPAVVRFISAEPLLEDLGLIDLTGIGWVIAGGESGPHARPCSVEWIRSIVRQCQAAHIPAFCKQLGARVHVRNDDSFNSEEEGAWPVELTAEDMEDLKWQHQGNLVRLKLRDRAGADPSEWAPDLRIRQFPTTKG
jgi:protein gp37